MQHDELTPALNKYFVYDRIFTLLDYPISLSGLKEELVPLTKPFYKDNYRFIFLHYDPDYYIAKDQQGLQLRNLQTILRELNISNYFCMVISQRNLQEELDQIAEQETNDDCSIFCLHHNLIPGHHFEYKKTNLNPENTEHNFMCLNRVKRKHRTALYALLKRKKLLNKGAVSYGAKE